MAEVVITMTDTLMGSAMNMDVQFNPPIDDKVTLSQSVALQLISRFQTRLIRADRNQITSDCHRRPFPESTGR